MSNIDKLTPLHLAAFNGHLEVCNLLLDSMGDKNPSDKNGRTPLHLAALQVLISIVLLLVLYQMGIPAYYFKEKIAIPPIYFYDIINQNRDLFKANNDIQKKFGRIILASDSAHSIGANYKGKKAGLIADMSSFSFHAVKNLTTAEGGAVVFNVADKFNMMN